jgi:hypothetical protein
LNDEGARLDRSHRDYLESIFWRNGVRVSGSVLHLPVWFMMATHLDRAGCSDLNHFAGARWLLGAGRLEVTLYISDAAPAVILGVIVVVCLTDQPVKAHWLTLQEQAERKAVVRVCSVLRSLFSPCPGACGDLSRKRHCREGLDHFPAANH